MGRLFHAGETGRAGSGTFHPSLILRRAQADSPGAGRPCPLLAVLASPA